MAVNIDPSIEYLGAFEAEANREYATTDITAEYSDADVFIMKSKGTKQENSTYDPVRVSIINGTVKSPSFEINFGEVSYFRATRVPALKFVFDKNCIIVIGKIK